LYELGGTPFSAKEVAPPARMDWPAMSLLKKSLMRRMKKDREGREPSARSQRSEEKGNNRSREDKYFLNQERGSIDVVTLNDDGVAFKEFVGFVAW
jgi:hypothetical protein